MSELASSTTAQLLDELCARFSTHGMPGMVEAVDELRDELTDEQLAYRVLVRDEQQHDDDQQ